MTAQDYPIGMHYGSTDAPYSNKSPHRGDDYLVPNRTELFIGDILAGLTGSTGYTTGPHLHVQEWFVDVANTRKPQHAFEGGTVVAANNNPDQQWGKHITTQNADGWNTTYAHLSEVNVKVGQVIGGEMVTNESLEDAMAIGLDRPPFDAERTDWVGKITDAQLTKTIRNSDEFKQRMDGLRKLWQESQNKKQSSEAEKKLQAIKDALK